jgi:hypothetical protein
MREPVDGECFYCSDVAETVDHVVPRATRERLEATMEPLAWRSYCLRMPDVVPCCADCNSRKGALVFDSVPEICGYLARQLEAKHRRVLSAPHWAEDELDALGPALRRDVEGQLAVARHVRRRLANLRHRKDR